MDTGDYLTNVVSAREFNRIRYTYFESEYDSPAAQVGISRIRGIWQGLGYLCTKDDLAFTKDDLKPGLWLFENGEADETTLPQGVSRSMGRISAEGIDLVIRVSGTYDFPALMESWRSMKAAPPSPSPDGSLPKDILQQHLRAAQLAAQNKQASASNSLLDVKNKMPQASLDVKDKFVILPFTIRKVHEQFLAAVLSSMSYVLCANKGYIPLAFRTLVVPKHDQSPHCTNGNGVSESHIDDEVYLVTLSADYTAFKVVVVRAMLSRVKSHPFYCSPDETLPFSHHHAKDFPILFGPGGIMGKFKGLVPLEKTSGQHAEPPSSTIMVTSNGTSKSSQLVAWIDLCLNWLAGKGIDIEPLRGEPWLFVELFLDQLPQFHGLFPPEDGVRKTAIVPWPSRLCFIRSTATLEPKNGQFVPLATIHPLEFAQNWLLAEGDRQTTLSKRRKEREAAEAATRLQADQEATAGLSPLAMRRNSLAGIVYPTPPDGIQHAPAEAPAFGRNATSPNQPLPADASLPADTIAGSEAAQDTVMQQDQNGEEDFPESGNENFDPDISNDDLFGDDNGVTDADFSFFDEPDMLKDASDGSPQKEASPASVLEHGDKFTSPMAMSEPAIAEDGDHVMANVDEQKVHTVSDTEAKAMYHAKQDSSAVNSSPPPDAFKKPERKPDSPLKPTSVFRRLSTFEVQPFATSPVVQRSNPFEKQESRRASADTEQSFQAFGEKYGPTGRFMYPSKPPSPPRLPTGLPTTDYFARQKKRLSKSQGKLAPAQPMFVFNDIKPNSQALLKTNSNNVVAAVDSSTDQDDSSDEQQSPAPLSSIGKRKRDAGDIQGENDTEDELMSASLQELQVDPDEINESKLETLDMAYLDADPAGWSLARYLSWPDSWSNSPIISDEDYVSTAQILTDQAMSRTFCYPQHGSKKDHRVKQRIDSRYIPRYVQQDVLEVAQRFFKDADACSLTNFLDIQGMPRQLPQLARLPPRPGGPKQSSHLPAARNATFPIIPPHLEVRRADSAISITPAAIPFWDVLGFSPHCNQKNVVAACLYPSGEGPSPLQDMADVFLDNMRIAYGSKRLGNFERLEADELADGIAPIILDQTAKFNADHGMSLIWDKLSEVAKAVISDGAEDTNYVIFVVYDPDNPELLVRICHAFSIAYRGYQEATADVERATELILQLVPFSMLGSASDLVIPTPAEFGEFAMEVYDRCCDFEIGWPSPSVKLEQPLPRSVELKLTQTPSESVLHENSSFHVVYTQSIDDRWISVSWSDNVGTEQHTASYCLGRKGEPQRRSFEDIAHEIWKTTISLISVRRVHWRLLLAKCGIIEPAEVQFWRSLASTESNANISLTLLTIDTDPSLQLIPPEIAIPPTTTQGASSAPTPQTNILSPDASQGQPPSTPAEPVLDPTLDSVLISLPSQTFGAILSHRNNNANCPLDIRPSMISGYIFKRGRSSEMPRVLEVNVIWTEMNPRILEAFLREILSWYVGLNTLACARGVLGREEEAGDPRPLGVVVVERAVRALHVLM